ncbi:MAG: hypothetical protein LBG48_03605 [Rickettsiales bacterium]|jgi:hypothetical protein|nr:hypothetical protein [Rickettsiales bacterium]
MKKSLRDSIKKKMRRARIAKSEGRMAGINGRPPFADPEISKILVDLLNKDASDGIYHTVKWICDMVYLIEIFSFFFRSLN